MGSMSNPNPWAPNDSYTDCSQGICNIYCPQWCYLIYPPPSFFNDEDDSSSSSSNFSPLLIALIGILASAFVLVSYYTLISKYCHRRPENSSSDETHNRDRGGLFSSSVADSRQGISNATSGDGLNDSLIESITVYKYRKGDSFVDCSDCSVCLSEFEENESLRLLPKCNHAFHLPCIDTWLKSHSNCPLCRAFVTGINRTTTESVNNRSSSTVHQIATESGNRGGRMTEINSNLADYHHQSGDSVAVIADLEIGSRNVNEISQSQTPEEQRDTKDDEDLQPIRRSVSLNSSTVMVSIADVLREIEDDERYEESSSVGTSQQRREEGEEDEHGNGKTPPLTAANQRSGGISSFLVRSTVAMNRSVSTGRFIFSRYDRASNYRLPI